MLCMIRSFALKWSRGKLVFCFLRLEVVGLLLLSS